ncbi:chaperone protein DnaJ [Candidatus Xenohaliotis californiensis]|uniref:Chaperone protein DnaJ n=1 Tax=Candidatus Xenohaliotis californiensis TaxID=84677 RepID=A0ABM9N9A7_9RICK|nr:chaperone protein DnaJ [Candidatus Xenohaliotis californiensis]
MTNSKDYYSLLGVGKTASADEIKKAYRKMAMKYHPDKNPDDKNAETKFKEATEAYQVLSDQQQRAAYDQYGTAGVSGQAGFGDAGGFDFTDIFSDLFGGTSPFSTQGGGRRSKSSAVRGDDTRQGLKITLAEAYKGKRVNLSFISTKKCEKCHATGSEDGARPSRCEQCKGIGVVRTQQGFFTIERSCPNCAGAGEVIVKFCSACGGEGRVRHEKKLSITIPPGIENGTKMRLSGEGHAGYRGGSVGDLFIVVTVMEHDFFYRQSDDLCCKIPIRMTKAALGCDLEVPHLDGHKYSIKIPEGTQTGSKFRLKNKGMRSMKSSRNGDLYVEIVVETPVHLTSIQKDILLSLDKELADRSSPSASGFFDKIKSWWSHST